MKMNADGVVVARLCIARILSTLVCRRSNRHLSHSTFNVIIYTLMYSFYSPKW